MGKTTEIAWTDATWNPWRGCDKVSPGCKHCYIVRTPPFRTTGQKHGDPRVLASDAVFNAPLVWNKRPWVCDKCGYATREELTNWTGWDADLADFHRRRVFSLSLGDWLDPKVPVEWLARMLDIIRQTENLDFLLLTKRPENWRDRMFQCSKYNKDRAGSWPSHRWLLDWVANDAIARPPSNVWLGTSIEDQQRADERIPELLKIPAKVRFLSCEPLLEDLGELDLTGIDWVIVGGESGPGFRPMKISWLESIAEQCASAGVPLFVKQDSSPKSGRQGRIPDSLWSRKEFPLSGAIDRREVSTDT